MRASSASSSSNCTSEGYLARVRVAGRLDRASVLRRCSTTRATCCLVVDEPERTEDELLRAAHDREITYEQSDNRWLPAAGRAVRRPGGGPRSDSQQATLYLQELAGEEPAASADVSGTCRHARPAATRAASPI